MTHTSSPGPTRLEDLTWTEFADRAPRVPYWLLVTGSTEQHGPHLPSVPTLWSWNGSRNWPRPNTDP